jgi:hypothetical protein
MVREFPATVSFTPQEDAFVPIVRLAQEYVPLTVTVLVVAIITLSVELGTTPPAQVVVALQLPVAMEVMVAACTLKPIAIKKSKLRFNLKLCVTIPIIFILIPFFSRFNKALESWPMATPYEEMLRMFSDQMLN